MIAASSRFATHLGYLGVRAFLVAINKPFGRKPNVDELAFARTLGLSEVWVSILVAGIFVTALCLLWRWTEGTRRKALLVAGVAGCLVAYGPMLAFGATTLIST